MKLKLAGLLLFSQAASAITAIDKTNYRQHLCDDGLLKPTSVVYEGSHDTTIMMEEMYRTQIKGDHAVYCQARSNYEIALELKGAMANTQCGGDASAKFITKEACREKAGIYYAQACERLKEHKVNPIKGHAWNEVVPTLESCNNARRR